MKFYLCRHGQTYWNAKRILQGQSQSELNQIGIEQATQLALQAQAWDIDIVISSHLRRAADTAAICAAQLDVEHVQYDDIGERNYGDWQGKAIATLTEFTEFRSNCYQQIERRPNPAAENTKEVRQRFTARLRAISAEYDDIHTALVVSHGDAIDCLLSQWTHPHYLKNSEFVLVNMLPNEVVVEARAPRDMPTTAV